MKKNNKPTDFITHSAKISMKAKRKSNWYLASIGLGALVCVTLYLMYKTGFLSQLSPILSQNHHRFYWMLLVGFCAEIVAGSMGMGYGVICTTVLLILNVPPAVISASIHSAETFTSAAGSLSHFKLKNVNKKLVKRLAIPAIIGAILGAIALNYFGEKYAQLTKPFIAIYTIYLGVQILRNAFDKKHEVLPEKKPTNITLLGFSGGFIDSFAGGGWGPLVTGTFIKNGRSPRYAIGSSTVAKFLLTLTSAVSFIFLLGGIDHWDIVAGLLIGGVITAPFSAVLTAKLPIKKMFLIVGSLVIIMGFITIYKSFLSFVG